MIVVNFILIYIVLIFSTCLHDNNIILEDTETEAEIQEEHIIMLAGTNEGLFSVGSNGTVTSLWNAGSVKKILLINNDEVLILGSEGIYISGTQDNFENWQPLNSGLHEKTVKIIENGEISFIQILQDLKDIHINVSNPDIMVTATRDHVYLSYDKGGLWTQLPLLFAANGIKTVASAYMKNNGEEELTVFASHGINGLYYIHPERRNARWMPLFGGLERMETVNNPDEVSSIAVIPAGVLGENTEIIVSQTFRRRIYRLDWERKHFDLIWSDNASFGTIDSLSLNEESIYFLSEGKVLSAHLSDFTADSFQINSVQ